MTQTTKYKARAIKTAIVRPSVGEHRLEKRVREFEALLSRSDRKLLEWMSGEPALGVNKLRQEIEKALGGAE